MPTCLDMLLSVRLVGARYVAAKFLFPKQISKSVIVRACKVQGIRGWNEHYYSKDREERRSNKTKHKQDGTIKEIKCEASRVELEYKAWSRCYRQRHQATSALASPSHPRGKWILQAHAEPSNLQSPSFRSFIYYSLASLAFAWYLFTFGAAYLSLFLSIRWKKCIWHMHTLYFGKKE